MQLLLAVGMAVCATGSRAQAQAPAADPGANYVTIDFDGLPGGNGTPFTTFDESGFKVRATRKSPWVVVAGYGNPAPFIDFNAPANTAQTGSVEVTQNGAPFSFSAVDVYSSINPFTYKFTGYLKGAVVFRDHGAVGQLYGDFQTVNNPHVRATIDRLSIGLTDPAGSCCTNPLGVDNIVLVVRK